MSDPILEITWFGPLTEWDLAIMEDFPYHCLINRCYLGQHEEIWRWAEEQFSRDSFTWKSARFFFKSSDDATLFRLRWA